MWLTLGVFNNVIRTLSLASFSLELSSLSSRLYSQDGEVDPDSHPTSSVTLLERVFFSPNSSCKVPRPIHWHSLEFKVLGLDLNRSKIF